MVCRRTFSSKLKALKTNVNTRIAIHSTLVTASSASTIFTNFLRHALKETNLYKSNHSKCI